MRTAGSLPTRRADERMLCREARIGQHAREVWRFVWRAGKVQHRTLPTRNVDKCQSASTVFVPKKPQLVVSTVRSRKPTSDPVRSRKCRYPRTPCHRQWIGRHCKLRHQRRTTWHAGLAFRTYILPIPGSRLHPNTTPLATLKPALARLPIGSLVSVAHEEQPELVADAMLALFCGAHASKQSQTRVLEIKMAYSPRTIYIIRYY